MENIYRSGHTKMLMGFGNLQYSAIHYELKIVIIKYIRDQQYFNSLGIFFGGGELKKNAFFCQFD